MIALWDRIAILLVCYNSCCLPPTSLHHWCSGWVWASSHEASPLEFQGCGVSVLLSPLNVWKEKKRKNCWNMQWRCGDSVLRMIDILRGPLRSLRRTQAPLEVCVDRFVHPALKSDGVWWCPQEDRAESSSRNPTAWCCLAPHTKCQAPRWAIVIMAVSPQGTFNLGGCAVNNGEPKKKKELIMRRSLVRWKYQIKSSLACWKFRTWIKFI